MFFAIGLIDPLGDWGNNGTTGRFLPGRQSLCVRMLFLTIGNAAASIFAAAQKEARKRRNILVLFAVMERQGDEISLASDRPIRHVLSL